METEKEETTQTKTEATWKDIFKYYLLIKTIFPGTLALIFMLIFGNYKGGSNLLTGIGVILIIGTAFGFLTFLNVAIVKLFNKTDEK